MQVKQRLRIHTAVSVIAMLVISAVLILAVYRINRALEAAKTTDAIITASFERLILRTDLHRTGSERSKTQLIAKHNQIGDLLHAALKQFPDDEDKKTINELLTNHESIGKLSRAIRENLEKTGLGARPDALSQEIEDRLLSQLNMRVYETILLDDKLQASSNKALISVFRLAGGSVLFVLLLISVAAAINSWTMGKTITGRISSLREGAASIGNGDLDHRIEIMGDDEFVELSEEFNAMTTRLRVSYHDLENEIEERTRAEWVLSKTADELQATNIELEQSRRAAINLLDDSLDARRQAEQAAAGLRESEEKFSLAFANNSAAMAMTRFEDGLFLDVNDTWLAMNGYSRDEVIGLSARKMPLWPTVEAGTRFVQELQTIGTLRGWEQELLKKSGEPYVAQMSAQILIIRGEPVILTTLVDITGRKRNENALLEKQRVLEESRAELEAANTMLSNSRRAALNMMADADIARRQAEQATAELQSEMVERKRAEEALQKSAERINLLAEIAGELLISGSSQMVVESLCQKVMAFLGCHVFFNFLVDEEQGRLHLNASAGIPIEEAKRIEWLDYGTAVCGCVARDACRIVAEDIPATPDPRTELVKSYGIQAYACHPLMMQGRVLGTLSFGTRTRCRFSDDDLSLMKAVADQVAIAMERMQNALALTKSHDVLEKRVAERTEQLSETVETLLIEMSNRERAEKGLQLLNKLYSVLSETNQTIVRAVDHESLFRDFCRIAVECGGFLLAWVGLVDDDSGQVEVVASCGATGYLDSVRITRNEEPVGLGPTGISIRNASYYICNNFQNDPCTRPWHEPAKLHGINSSASVALKEEGRVIGALTLYSGEKAFFDQQHAELIRQMGEDVSFALDYLVREEQRRKTERALREETLERLRTVEELRKQERMLIQQNRQAAMGEMIGNIAHQWRQPLNTLGLFTQRLGFFYGSPSFNKEFLDTTVAKSMEIIQYMSRTIDDFRNFFSTEREKSEFRVDYAVDKALSLVEANFKERRILIERVERDDVVAYGFPNEYAQVLLNIFINARDAMNEHNVEFPRLKITIGAENGVSLVTIADNAGGIPEDIIDRIFDPYFTTKGPQQGTGVGLFMAKTIIESKMGGRLTVRNTGEGAEFLIEV